MTMGESCRYTASRLAGKRSAAMTEGAAAVALAVASGVRKSPRDIRAHLKTFAVDAGVPGRDDTFGWGVLRLDRPCET